MQKERKRREEYGQMSNRQSVNQALPDFGDDEIYMSISAAGRLKAECVGMPKGGFGRGGGGGGQKDEEEGERSRKVRPGT